MATDLVSAVWVFFLFLLLLFFHLPPPPPFFFQVNSCESFSKNLFKQPAFRFAGFSFSASFFALLPWLFLLLYKRFSLTCLKVLHSHEVVWSVRHAARQDFILYAGIYSYKFHLKDYCGGLLQVWGRLGRSPGWAQGTHCALLLPGVPDPGLFRHCCDNGHCYTKVSREEWKSHYNRSTSPYNPR